MEQPSLTGKVGVLIFGADAAVGDALVGAVATGTGLGEVRAIEVADGLPAVEVACRRLAELCDAVIGLGVAPWPGWGVWHEVARTALGDIPYWAIETWHGLPALAGALEDAVGAGWVDGSRVVLTAPDPALRALPAEQRTVLRDVAEALKARTSVRVTVAIDRSPPSGAVTPTAITTVTTLAEAHGATRVVRCSLQPGDVADPDVTAAAAAVGIDLVDAAIDRPTHIRLLLDAIATLLREAAGGAGR